MRRPRLVAVIVSAIVVFGLIPANAAEATGSTLEVGSGGYATIQAAVNAAQTGDVIQVASGTYVENVVISGKYITLRGNPGSPQDVVIKAASAGVAPLFISNVPDTAPHRVLIEGFTITGGNSQPGQGGGITVAISASPELRFLIVTANAAQGYGGGISIHDNSNPFIHDSVISSNVAISGGGGVFVVNNSSPVIVGNQIIDNSTYGATIANGGSSGGGVYFENVQTNPALRSTPTLLGNIISGNSATFAGGGVMLRTGVNALIEANVITENVAAYGGGIHAETTGSSVTIDGNTISNNRAIATGGFSGSGYGGGIAVFDQSVVSILRNTIQNNQATNGGAGISASEASSNLITGNLISGNVADDSNSSTNSEGGGVYVSHASVTAVNNVVTSNEADIGGAFGLLDNSVSTIAYNTIVKNIESVAAGGAIFVRNDGGHSVTSAAIVNNILTQNDGYQIFEQAPKARIDNNLIATPSARPAQSGSGLYFSYVTNGLNTVAAINSSGSLNAQGNISGDPAFASFAANDFRLTSTSSAIDAATTVDAPPVAVDFRQAKRTSLPPDVGAFEYESTPVLVTDPVVTGIAQVGQVLTVTPGTWGTAPATLAFQWLRGVAPISGATGTNYTPVLADVGQSLSVTVVAAKYGEVSRQTSTVPTAPVARGPYFADVGPGNAFFNEIEWMAASGISTGTPNPPGAPLYLPSSAVSRQAMAAFLMRLSEDTFTAPATPTFADVDSSFPFYTAIEWMADQGISTGTAQPSGKPLYKPADPVSRQAMALFLARYAHADISVPPTTQVFADVPTDSAPAAAIDWMKSAGISTGTAQPSGLPLYKPADPVSRQAMAAFLNRLSLLP